MKDCYSFDIDTKSALRSYERMNDAYRKIFTAIGIPFVEVQGDNGEIGGSQSLEYHFPSQVGEDVLLSCENCLHTSNIDLASTNRICPACKGSNLLQSRGIEIGHTFLLEDIYSKALGASYLMHNGKPAPILMGCYGIGITRLIAASIECLSLEHEIRWPFVLAPYKVCIISSKAGSKEEKAVEHLVEHIYSRLELVTSDDVIVDDRNDLTIGKRLMEAKRYIQKLYKLRRNNYFHFCCGRLGYPMIIVIGSKAAADVPIIELYQSSRNYSCDDVQLSDLFSNIECEINKNVYA